MAQSVVYADLRFVKAPREGPMCAPCDDAELTYENVRLAQTVEVKTGQGVEHSEGECVAVSPHPQPRDPGGSKPGRAVSCPPAGCRAPCGTALGRGVLQSCCGRRSLEPPSGVPGYWQVSQHLQQASRAHEAESSHLSQQVSTKGATLEQTARELEQARRELEQTRRELEQARRELEQARRELEQLRQEGNSTQEQLRQREAELKGTKEQLARVQEEKREIKEKLNQTQKALSSIRPCEQTGTAFLGGGHWGAPPPGRNSRALGAGGSTQRQGRAAASGSGHSGGAALPPGHAGP
uniref:Uncharacterized protein n=1 Tax=Chelydra serpentina TaxID=8475 RepID=A0A8C3T9G5_CHESE